MQEFYSDKTARVFYDNELDALFLEYVGRVANDQQFVTINTAVLNAFKTLKTQKFVADIRKMGIISLASQQWVINNLLPGMIKHLNGNKLFHVQLLDQSEILSKVSATNIKSKANKVSEGFEIFQGTNREEIKTYLKDCK